MKYMYQLMWIDTRLPVHNRSEIYETVEAYSVHEALQLASYKYSVGLQWSIPVLEVRILGARI
jgi:hypothetical protein